MMEEPGCIGGRLISLKPVLGPEERILKSLQILESLIAKLFNAEEYATYAPVSGVASTKSFAKTMGYPVILQRCLTQACAQPGAAFKPVPMAVAPIFTSLKKFALYAK